MHSIELLEEAIQLAKQVGFQVRQEWVGTGGGTCEFHGQRWLFIDLSASVLEQLECVREALRDEPAMTGISLTPPLARLLAPRRAA